MRLEIPQATVACSQCGHPEGAHLFNAATQYPSEGWVSCPEPGCDCYSTWSLDDKSKPEMDKIRAEHEAQLGDRQDVPKRE